MPISVDTSDAKTTLTVNEAYVQKLDSRCRLCYEILIGEESHLIWYEFEEKYQPYVSTSSINGIVVHLLYYAMEHGYDIKSHLSLSERLHYQLTTYLIPAITTRIEKYQPINIDVPLTNEIIDTAHGIGTGMSAGVDAFYTYFKHEDLMETNHNITHLCLFNDGAFGSLGGSSARNIFQQYRVLIKNVSKELNKEFLWVDTNINEFLQQMHVETHSMRTTAIPLLFPKLFDIYYFASSYCFDRFKIVPESSAFYNLLIVQCLSTENLTFYESGSETTRLKKLQFIDTKPFTHNHLLVCNRRTSNCSHCEKCLRTMMGLYAIDALEHYDKVFDTESFEQNKRRAIAQMISHAKHPIRPHPTADIYWNEIYELLKDKLTLSDYLYSYLWIFYQKHRPFLKPFKEFVQHHLSFKNG